MEHRFGREAPFAVGVEEELLLLDPATGMLSPTSSGVVPSANAIEAARHLEALRRAVRDARRHARGRRDPPGRAVRRRAALEEVDRILAEGNGADRMRAAHAEGGMPRVLRRLIEESAEPLGAPARAA